MDTSSIKRLAAFLIGLLAIVLNKKLGLELDASTQAAIVTIVLGFIGQSAWKEAKLAGSGAPEVPAPPSDAAAANTIAKIP